MPPRELAPWSDDQNQNACNSVFGRADEAALGRWVPRPKDAAACPASATRRLRSRVLLGRRGVLGWLVTIKIPVLFLG